MNTTAAARQRARDRAADGIAIRELVVLGPKGWAPPTYDPLMHQRRYNARRRRGYRSAR